MLVFVAVLPYGQAGRAGFGVMVKNAISNDRSERSGVVPSAFTLASFKQGKVGFGVTVK